MRTARGLTIFAIAATSAPLIAAFFEKPLLVTILPVVAVTPLLNMVENPVVAYFRKNLYFRKQFIYQLSGTVANTIVALGATLVLENLWALVFGLVVSELAKSVISYFIHDYRPGLGFDLDLARDLLSFGKWLQFSTILIFVATQGDDLFVGWYLAPVRSDYINSRSSSRTSPLTN
jgi:O-antigen/teichoic acid export membrane protein